MCRKAPRTYASRTYIEISPISDDTRMFGASINRYNLDFTIYMMHVLFLLCSVFCPVSGLTSYITKNVGQRRFVKEPVS